MISQKFNLWPTLKENKTKSSSVCTKPCFHTNEREWGGVHNQNSFRTEEKLFDCSGSSASCYSAFLVWIPDQQQLCHFKVVHTTGSDAGHHRYFNPPNTRNFLFLAHLPLPATGKDSSTSIKELTEMCFVLDSCRVNQRVKEKHLQLSRSSSVIPSHTTESKKWQKTREDPSPSPSRYLRLYTQFLYNCTTQKLLSSSI